MAQITLGMLQAFFLPKVGTDVVLANRTFAPVGEGLDDIDVLVALIPEQAAAPVRLTVRVANVQMSGVLVVGATAGTSCFGVSECPVTLVFLPIPTGVAVQIRFEPPDLYDLATAFPSIQNDVYARAMARDLQNVRFILCSRAGQDTDGAPLEVGLDLRFDKPISQPPTGAYHPIGSLLGNVLTPGADGLVLSFVGTVADVQSPQFQLAALLPDPAGDLIHITVHGVQVGSVAFLFSRHVLEYEHPETGEFNTAMHYSLGLVIQLEIYSGYAISLATDLPIGSVGGQLPMLRFSATVEPPLPLPSLSSLASLVGDADLSSALPPELAGVAGGLSLIGAGLLFDSVGNEIVAASVTLGWDREIPLVPGSDRIVLEGWELTFSIVGGSTSVVIAGSIPLPGTAELLFTIALPSFELGATLACDDEGNPPALSFGQVAASIGLTAPDELSTITVNDLALTAWPRDRSWSLAVDVNDTGRFCTIFGITINLEDLSFSFAYSPAATELTVAAQIAAPDAWGSGLVIDFQGTYASGWSLAGQLEGSIPLLEVVKAALPGLATDQIPESLRLLKLDALSLAWSRNAGGTSESLSAALELAGSFEALRITFDAATLSLQVSKTSGGTATGTVQGTLGLDNQIFAASCKLGTEKDLVLTYDNYSVTIAQGAATPPLTGKVVTGSLTIPSIGLGAFLRYFLHKLDAGLDPGLYAPWDVLEHIELANVQGTLTFTSDSPHKLLSAGGSFSFSQAVDLGFISLTGVGVAVDFQQRKPTIELFGTFLGRTYDTANPLSWNPQSGSPPRVPGLGSSLVDVRLLALGQHLALSPRPTTVQGAVNQLSGAFSGASLHQALTGGGLAYDAGADLVLGADLTVLGAFRLAAVFQDPDVYGLLIQLSGPRVKALAGLSVEVMYRKLSRDLGEYSLELQLPDAMRHIQLGEVSLTLPVIGIDIWTDGSFLIDLGFPHGGDFTDSFQVEVLPFVGAGGFYFGALDGATSRYVPVISNGRFSPVIQLGIGVQLGVGKTFNAGPLSAGAELVVQGILQGVLGFFHPDDASTPHEDFFQVQGSAALVARIWATLDLGIISASVTATAYAALTLAIESHQPIEITASFGLEVDVEARIVFIHVHFHETFHFSASFTIGSASPTPWIVTRPAAALPPAMSLSAQGGAGGAAQGATPPGGTSAPVAHGGPMVLMAMPSAAAAATSTFAWALPSSFTYFASRQVVTLWLSPAIAASDAGHPMMLPLLFVENGFHGTAEPDLDVLAELMLGWALQAWIGGSSQALSATRVGSGDLAFLDAFLSRRLSSAALAAWVRSSGVAITAAQAAAVMQELEEAGQVTSSGAVANGAAPVLSPALAPFAPAVATLLAGWATLPGSAGAPLFSSADLATCLGSNVQFSLQAATSALAGSLFPMPPVATVKHGGAQESYGADALPGQLFANWFGLLQRSAVQQAKRLLDAWPVTVDPAANPVSPADVASACGATGDAVAGFVADLFVANQSTAALLTSGSIKLPGGATHQPSAGDTLASIAQAYQCSLASLAASNRTNTQMFGAGTLRVPSALVTVQDLMTALKGAQTPGDSTPSFGHVAAAVSRFFLHGSRTPAGSGTQALYAAAGLELPAAENHPVVLAIDTTGSPLEFTTKTLSVPLTADQNALLANWQLAKQTLPPAQAEAALPYASGPRRFSPGPPIAWAGAPPSVTWQADKGWPAGATANPQLWPFPRELRRLLASSGPLALTPQTASREANGGSRATPLTSFAFGTLVRFKVRRTPADGVYAVVHVAQDALTLIEALLAEKASAPSTGVLLFPSGTPGSEGVVTDPGAPLILRTTGADDDTLPASAALATHVLKFLRLLRAVGHSHVAGAGVCLVSMDANQRGSIPAAAFGGGGTAELRLLLVSSDAASAVAPARNCLVTRGTLDPRSMMLSLEAGVTAAHEVLKAGQVGVEWLMPRPPLATPALLDVGPVATFNVATGNHIQLSGPAPQADADGVSKRAELIQITDTRKGKKWASGWISVPKQTPWTTVGASGFSPLYELILWVLPAEGSEGRSFFIAGGGKHPQPAPQRVTLPATLTWMPVSLIVSTAHATAPLAFGANLLPPVAFYLAVGAGDLVCATPGMQSAQQLVSSYQVLGTAIAKGPFQAATFAPVGPIVPAGQTAGTNGPLAFSQTIDLTQLSPKTPPTNTPGQPPAGESPYLALGNSVTVDLDLRDFYGNESPVEIAPLTIPVVYTDPLLPCDRWPGTTTHYDIATVKSNPQLAVTVGFDPTRYLPTAQRSFAQQRRRAASDRRTWARIFHQLSQPDVLVGVETSIGSTAGGEHSAALSAQAAEIWNFLGAFESAIAPVTSSSGGTLSALEVQYGTRPEAIAAANAQIPGLFTSGMVVPSAVRMLAPDQPAQKLSAIAASLPQSPAPVTLASLAELNGGTANLLVTGLPVQRGGVTHVIARGETLRDVGAALGLADPAAVAQLLEPGPAYLRPGATLVLASGPASAAQQAMALDELAVALPGSATVAGLAWLNRGAALAPVLLEIPGHLTLDTQGLTHLLLSVPAGKAALAPDALGLSADQLPALFSVNRFFPGLVQPGSTLQLTAPGSGAALAYTTGSADTLDDVWAPFRAAVGDLGLFVSLVSGQAFLAPGTTWLLPPAPVTISAPITTPVTNGVLRLTATLSLQRTQHLCRGMDLIADTTLQSAVSNAVANANSNVRPHAQVGSDGVRSLAPFARALEAAIAGVKVAWSRDGDGLRSLWSVPWGEGSALDVAVDAGAPARFFTPLPLATSAVSRTGVPIAPYAPGQGLSTKTKPTDVNGVDLDAWACSFLDAFDALLAPGTAARIAQASSADWSTIITAREQIAAAIAGSVASVFPAAGEPPDVLEQRRASAAAAMAEQLAAKLGAAYATDTVIQYGFSVGNGLSPQGDASVVSLLGKVAPQPGSTPPMSLVTAPLEVGSAKAWLNSALVSARTGDATKTSPTIAALLQYAITGVRLLLSGADPEDVVDAVFVVPPGPIVLNTTALNVPVVLRGVPVSPTVLSQSAVATHPQAVDPVLARQWNYAVTWQTHDLQAQDSLLAVLRFNEATTPSIGNTPEASGSGGDLVSRLAQAHHVVSALAADLAPGSAPEAAAGAAQAFATIAARLGGAWQAWHEVRARAAGGRNAYVFAIGESSGPPQAKQASGPATLAGVALTGKAGAPQTLSVAGLDLLQFQNAWAGIQQVRNAVFDGAASDDRFVYRTPEVGFANRCLPAVMLATALPAAGPDLATALSAFFATLFDTGTTSDNPGPFQFKLACNYRFPLGSVSVDVPVLMQPQRLFGPRDADGTPGSFTGQLAAALQAWLGARQPAPGGSFVIDITLLGTAGEPSLVDKLCNFLARNNTAARPGARAPTVMPLSFYAEPEYWIDNPQTSSSLVDAVTERLDVHYGADIYDVATAQIALSLKPDFLEGQEMAANWTRRLLSRSSGALGDIYGDNPKYFTYHIPSSGPIKSSGGYLFRSIADQYYLQDPLTGEEVYPASARLPATESRLIWVDWKPITGENAWAALLGPLHFELRRRGGIPPLDSQGVTLALNLLPAFQSMQHPGGGLYYAPKGTVGNVGSADVDPFFLSHENNASALSGIVLLLQVLNGQTPAPAPSVPHVAAASALATGICNHLEQNFYDPDTGTLVTGGTFAPGWFVPGENMAQYSGPDADTAKERLVQAVAGAVAPATGPKGAGTGAQVWGDAPSAPQWGAVQSVRADSATQWSVLDFALASYAKPSWKYVAVYVPAAGKVVQTLTFYGIPFAVDVHTWGMTALGVQTIDTWFGLGQPPGASAPVTAYGLWQMVKQRAGYFEGGDTSRALLGVGYSDVPNGDHQSVISAEWTFGAINFCRAAAAQYTAMAASASPSEAGTLNGYAASLSTDAQTMLLGVRALMLDLSRNEDDLAAYFYTNRRYDIPFGWWGNRIASLCSTAWAVMVEEGFNPFDIEGSYARSPAQLVLPGSGASPPALAPGGTPAGPLGALAAAGVPRALQKRVLFLIRNNTRDRNVLAPPGAVGFLYPTGMPLSFWALPGWFRLTDMKEATPTERIIIQNGVDIYDAATMQVALAAFPAFAAGLAYAEQHTYRLLSGESAPGFSMRGWTDPRNNPPPPFKPPAPTAPLFFYGLERRAFLPPPHERATKKEQILGVSATGPMEGGPPDANNLLQAQWTWPVDPFMGATAEATARDSGGPGAYFFRAVTDQQPALSPPVQIPDPASSAAPIAPLPVPTPPPTKPPPSGTYPWEDYKPITGENAWACLIGPLQVALAAGGELPGMDDPGVRLALTILPALKAMTTPVGGLFYAPWNTAGNVQGTEANPLMLSVENNASSLAGLRMLRRVLAGNNDTQYLPDVEALIAGVESFLGGVLDTTTGFIHTCFVWDDRYGGLVPGTGGAGSVWSCDDPAGACRTALAAMAAGPGSASALRKALAAFTPSSVLPPKATPKVVAAPAPAGQVRWNVALFDGTKALPGFTVIGASGASGPLTLYQEGPFAVDVHTWGMTVLGVDTVDAWGANAPAGAPAITVFDIWQRVKARGGVFSRGVLAGVGYSDTPTPPVVSGEWTFGAINLCRCAASQYRALAANPSATDAQATRWNAFASGLEADAALMAAWVQANLLVTAQDGLPTGIEAYDYANRRYQIPFGWYANVVPSLCSTAWSVLVDAGFNPFELGGGAFPDTVTYGPDPRELTPPRPLFRASDVVVPLPSSQ